MSWQWEIKSETPWFDLNLKEVWSYRHLLARLVRRDFLALYQQTLLGPVWVVLQPLLTVLIYVIVFNKVVKIPTGDIPPVLFYLAGIIQYNLFTEILTGTAFSFTNNATIFSKVYFPRLIVPLSVAASQILRFLIQFGLFLCFYAYFFVSGTINADALLLFPALLFAILITTGLALGFGLMFSVWIARYRDLGNVIHLGIRLLLFATPVFYPFDFIPGELQKWSHINPLTIPIEFFRLAFLGRGEFSMFWCGYTIFFCTVVLTAGVLLFNKKSTKLIDVA